MRRTVQRIGQSARDAVAQPIETVREHPYITGAVVLGAAAAAAGIYVAFRSAQEARHRATVSAGRRGFVSGLLSAAGSALVSVWVTRLCSSQSEDRGYYAESSEMS